MITIPIDQLRETDTIIRLDDQGRVTNTCQLKREIPTLGCLGRHFITQRNSLVCYGPGKVLIMSRIGC